MRPVCKVFQDGIHLGIFPHRVDRLCRVDVSKRCLQVGMPEPLPCCFEAAGFGDSGADGPSLAVDTLGRGRCILAALYIDYPV